MKIKLVPNGIFPITTNLHGERISHSPKTGYSHPGTFQGEGKLAGIPVLFVRTSGCNLRCTWQTEAGKISICDTPYASHSVEATEEWECNEIVEILRKNRGPIRHVIISGGEPTIQPDPLVRLARLIKQELGMHITLETNGVLFIQELVRWIDLFSISPKLSSSDPSRKKNQELEHPVGDEYMRDHARFRRNTETLQRYINACMNLGNFYGDDPEAVPTRKSGKDFQLKFVIAAETDLQEIRRDFLSALSFVEQEDVLLMPVGATPELLRETSVLVAGLAVRYGYRFCPRLQIDLYGNTAGT